MTFLRKPWRDLCRHGKSVRPIPVLRWAWWVVFQHGRLSWAPPSWILNSPPDWLKITSAILDLENNRVYCSRNNSLLSFSAPDWLPVIWVRYSSQLSHDIYCFKWGSWHLYIFRSQFGLLIFLVASLLLNWEGHFVLCYIMFKTSSVSSTLL